MTAKTFTALDQIIDEMQCSKRAQQRQADKRDVPEWQREVDMESYYQGEAVAFNRAHEIMKAELERLATAWQNGCIHYRGDFGVY